jgi:hypothetical protein
MKLNTLTDSELLKSLLREVTESGKQIPSFVLLVYFFPQMEPLCDQEIEKEIKATGHGRPDTMSRVINPPNNGL